MRVIKYSVACVQSTKNQGAKRTLGGLMGSPPSLTESSFRNSWRLRLDVNTLRSFATKQKDNMQLGPFECAELPFV